MSIVTEDRAGDMLGCFGIDEEEAAEQAAPTNGNGHGPTFGTFDLESFLAKHLRARLPVPYEGGTKWVLEECPFDPDHKAPDSAIFRVASGPIGFKCLHNSCADKKWKDVRLKFEPDYQRKPSGAEKIIAERVEVVYQSLTLTELANVPAPEYLIPDILVRSQPGVIAGQWKSLKTTIAVELSYCLATCEPFLGQFSPARPFRVGMFSGEAGPFELRDLVRRIAWFHGDDNPWRHDGLIFSCERLPKIGSIAYMDALVRWIEQHRLDVVIIDPGYAALAAIGNQAGNYYAVADLLFQVTELQRKTGCVMLLCPHMTKAPKYDPPQLSDIQWSGFSEWSGQWLLMGKRREWDDQRGDHWLWLVAAGRTGHADTWGLDVHEGKRTDVGGKVFEPVLIDKAKAFMATAEAVEQTRERIATHKRQQEEHAAATAIRAAFEKLGDGFHIKARVLERTGTSGRGKAINAAWATMLNRKQIEQQPDVCKGGNGKTIDGYRLTRKD